MKYESRAGGRERASCLIKFQFIYKAVTDTHIHTHTLENGLESMLLCVVRCYFLASQEFFVPLSLGLVAAITYSSRLPHMCRTAKCPLFCMGSLEHMLSIKRES